MRRVLACHPREFADHDKFNLHPGLDIPQVAAPGCNGEITQAYELLVESVEPLTPSLVIKMSMSSVKRLTPWTIRAYPPTRP